MFKKNLAALIIILLIALTIVIILVLREQGELSTAIAGANISSVMFGGKKATPEQAELGSKTAGQMGEQIESE